MVPANLTLVGEGSVGKGCYLGVCHDWKWEGPSYGVRVPAFPGLDPKLKSMKDYMGSLDTLTQNYNFSEPVLSLII